MAKSKSLNWVSFFLCPFFFCQDSASFIGSDLIWDDSDILRFVGRVREIFGPGMKKWAEEWPRERKQRNGTLLCRRRESLSHLGYERLRPQGDESSSSESFVLDDDGRCQVQFDEQMRRRLQRWSASSHLGDDRKLSNLRKKKSE